jgi:hypothetical protein
LRYQQDRGLASLHRELWPFARLMGDVSAVKKGTVGKRIGRRFVGKMMGRGIGRLFG